MTMLTTLSLGLYITQLILLFGIVLFFGSNKYRVNRFEIIAAIMYEFL